MTAVYSKRGIELYVWLHTYLPGGGKAIAVYDTVSSYLASAYKENKKILYP